jgi:Alpha amylase, catalytic domain
MTAQWGVFLRNHDELDLDRLSTQQRQTVFNAFGPKPEMQLYDRDIRRRLAPMLNGDRRRLELAYSLMFTLPGTPMIRYGDEIGMGDDSHFQSAIVRAHRCNGRMSRTAALPKVRSQYCPSSAAGRTDSSTSMPPFSDGIRTRC